MREWRKLSILLTIISLAGCGNVDCPPQADGIDHRSYMLGILGGFSEVVRLGVKELALSEVLAPEEMDDLMDDAQIIADRNEVLLYREADLLVTDLYPADVAEGKDVLLVYTGDTLDKYLAIKTDKQQLIATDQYEGDARREIARRFGRLLSYPEPMITKLISKQADST